MSSRSAGTSSSVPPQRNQLDRPTNPAIFAGATINGVFGYTTTDGTLHAIHVR